MITGFDSIGHLRVIANLHRQHWGQQNVNAGYIDWAAAEIERLRAALFDLQCQQLDQGTNEGLSATAHRRYAMKNRDKIISILNPT